MSGFLSISATTNQTNQARLYQVGAIQAPNFRSAGFSLFLFSSESADEPLLHAFLLVHCFTVTLVPPMTQRNSAALLTTIPCRFGLWTFSYHGS